MQEIEFSFEDECAMRFMGPTVGSVGFFGNMKGYYKYAFAESQQKKGMNKQISSIGFDCYNLNLRLEILNQEGLITLFNSTFRGRKYDALHGGGRKNL